MSFEEVLASLPEEIRKEVESFGIKSFDDVFDFMLMNGLDPMKMMDCAEKGESFGKDFKWEDVMIDEDSFNGAFFDDDDDEDDDDDDDEEEDDDDAGGYGLDDEQYLLGMKLPKQKFIGKSEREFHIRIKLNDAPVKIWRELLVPSNITLEMLAFVLIDAMGWGHEHLYHFIGKNNTFYENSAQLRESVGSFMAFFARSQHRNSEKTSLEMVLQPKGERLQFEYDFGDSWNHDLWVKGAREYAPGEEPVIKLLKGQGECPPEDCGGVWGYADLLELIKKKRKSADDKDRLDWYGIHRDYDPDYFDLNGYQHDIDSLWHRIKEEM